MKMEDLPMETNELDTISEPLISNYESVTLTTENASNTDDKYEFPALFTSRTLFELSSSSWSRSFKADDSVQPYLRGCKWSPDGTCCLTVVNNDGVHVTELPRELYSGDISRDRNVDVLDSVINVKESGMIYDFCWYPGMNSGVPESCCWLTTRQNGPIQMWDAFDGSLRCTYRGFDWADELDHALTIAFTVDGSKIVAGYKKALRTFDVDRPGREYVEHKIAYPASCLAMDRNLLAVGSWNTTISLYSVTETSTYKSIGKMHGHGGGVTHMKFTPDGLKLVTGARKDHRLLVWDIRYYRRPLNILSRVNNTNQRIYFDISPCGKYLVSGGTDGVVKVWDVDHVDWKNSLDSENMDGDNVTHKFLLHNDCCNSISIHPFRPILATGSGQLHLRDPTISLEDSPLIAQQQLEMSPTEEISQCKSNNDLKVEIEIEIHNKDSILDVSTKNVDMKYSSYAENSLVFWWTGDVPDLT